MSPLALALDGLHLALVLGAAALGGMTTWVSMKLSLAQVRRDLELLSQEIQEHQRDTVQHIHREALDAKLDRLHDGLVCVRQECREIKEALGKGFRQRL